MSKFNMVRRCYSCGAILQSDDPNAEGYLPERFLDADPATAFLCDKCYHQQRFNLAPAHPKVDQDYLTIIEDAQASDALIVYVVDLFSFETSFIPEVIERLQGLRILVVANKYDLLPTSVKEENIREYVAHRFRVAHLSVTKDDVMLATLTSASPMEEFASRIESLRTKHDVYILGATGVGKTLLVYSFLREFKNLSGKNITTSLYPGTNLHTMQIPLDSSSYLYDTPGTSLDNSILACLDGDERNAVTPLTAVKGRNFTVAEGDTLLVGGVARIELLSGKRQSITVYFAKDVTVTKVRSSNADAAFLKGIEKGNVVPISARASTLTDFDAFDIVVDEQGKRDIGIEGLGWFSFYAGAQTFRVYLPKGVSLYTSRSKVKDKE